MSFPFLFPLSVAFPFLSPYISSNKRKLKEQSLKYSILIDSDQFMESFRQDVLAAQNSVYIQALTFEADDAGNRVINLLKKSAAPDKRIMADSYSKAMVSDHFVYSVANLFKKNLRKEIKDTRNFEHTLPQLGIRFKWINPLGFLLSKYAHRNHKKIITIDDSVCYLGGINFGEHNFDWHDMMLRIENDSVTEFLKQDFLKTWDGENQSTSKKFPGIEIVTLDGFDNSNFFNILFEHFETAQKSILIESPYLSFPFFDVLRSAKKRGVKIDLIGPKQNNKGFMQIYTQWETKRSGVYLWRYRKNMTHLKAVLVDDKTLFIGSTNCDFISYHSQQEIQAIITDPNIIRDFKEKIFEPDYYNSDLDYGNVSPFLGRLIYFLMKLLGAILVKSAKRGSKKS